MQEMEANFFLKISQFTTSAVHLLRTFVSVPDFSFPLSRSWTVMVYLSSRSAAMNLTSTRTPERFNQSLFTPAFRKAFFANFELHYPKS